MKKLYSKLLVLAGVICLALPSPAQYVGIGEANPNSKVDAVHAGATGNTIEVTHSNTANGSSAIWVKHSGIGRALNVQSLNAANNIPSIQVNQYGTGGNSRGIDIDMDATSVATGLAVFQDGTGDGIYTNPTGPGYGMFNVIDGTGGAVYNLKNGTGTFSTVDDLSNSAGGIGNYIFFDGAAGNAISYDSIGGDGFGMIGTINTATPNIANIVSGAVVAGQQVGLGHGILINHSGAAGRGAEFNITNANNPDPALFITHQGGTDVAVIQNQSNFILGTIRVVDAAYTGTDVADHIGVSGQSFPAAGWGVGVRGDGNYAGVIGVGGDYGMLAAGTIAAYGGKAFLIDHPQDPANKYLRHFSIESNEIMNVYRGNASLDANGEATVTLPAYFEDVNTDFTYQLTAIGTPVQPWVKAEVTGNQFKVAGDPNSKVSWMVMAKRNDPYVKNNPDKFTDEYEKREGRKGKYLIPELYGASPAEGILAGETAENHSASKAAPTKGKEEMRIMKAEMERRAKENKKALRNEPNNSGN